MNQIIPIPKQPITIREATPRDIPFIDAMQKQHSKQVGWMPTKQLEGKIAANQVLVAEANGEPIGYCIGQDRYFKRDDVGIIYQLLVSPGRQRGFVGATLLKAMFDRAAYGCRLFCCWCAQDIEANRFWESMGFVPLAFRAGSEKKSRTHIFWQKRIRQDDHSTPWWFPTQTTGGAIREDRLVLPIPPQTHWSEVKPIILPNQTRETKALPAPRRTQQVKPVQPKRVPISLGRMGAKPIVQEKPKAEKAPKPKREKQKYDPKAVSTARTMNAMYLEQVNDRGYELEPAGKYDLTRAELPSPIQTAPLQLAA